MVSSLSSSSMLLSPALGMSQAATTSANSSSTSPASTAVASPPIYNSSSAQSGMMQLIGKMLELFMMMLTQKMGSTDSTVKTYPASTSTSSSSTADNSKYDPDAAGYAAASKSNVPLYGYGLSASEAPKTVAAAAPVLSAPKAVVATPAPAPVATAATPKAAAPQTQTPQELAKILGRA